MKLIVKLTLVFLCTVLSFSSVSATELTKDCPCYGSINALNQAYQNDAVFKFLVDKAFDNMQPVPEGYRKGGNPWIGKSIADLSGFLQEWCTFLPTAKGSSDDGLYYIEQMDLFPTKILLGPRFFKLPLVRTCLSNLRMRGGRSWTVRPPPRPWPNGWPIREWKKATICCLIQRRLTEDSNPIMNFFPGL